MQTQPGTRVPDTHNIAGGSMQVLAQCSVLIDQTSVGMLSLSQRKGNRGIFSTKTVDFLLHRGHLRVDSAEGLFGLYSCKLVCQLGALGQPGQVLS